MNIESVINSVQLGFKERTNSSLFFTFVLSWLVYNWKLWYVTFLVEKGANKDFIAKYLLNDHLLWEPIYSTLLIIILLPFMNSGVKFLNGYQRKVYLKAQKKVPISKEEAKEIRDQIADVKVMRKQEITNLSSYHIGEVNSFKDRLSQYETKNGNLNQSISNLKLEIESIEIAFGLMKLFYQNNSTTEFIERLKDNPNGLISVLKSSNEMEWLTTFMEEKELIIQRSPNGIDSNKYVVNDNRLKDAIKKL